MRLLAVAHIIAAVALLPMTLFLGAGVAPLLVVLPLWYGLLGIWLFRPSLTVRTALRTTHIVMAPFALGVGAYGVFALKAAQRSAEGGGGLLGTFGVIPIVISILLVIVTVWSLLVIRRWPKS